MNKEEINSIIETFERHYIIEKNCGNLTKQTKDIALLINYIIELQQENEELKADYGSKAQVERDLLQMRIDKAIELIEKHNLKSKVGNTCELDEWLLIKDLLKILRGNSNE